MLKKYLVDKLKILFTVTDSLCYGIETDYFFKDISQDLNQKFDMTNFPKNQEFLQEKAKKVIGMTKDEAGVKIIEELVELMHEGKDNK